jgi:hypothetical protein
MTIARSIADLLNDCGVGVGRPGVRQVLRVWGYLPNGLFSVHQGLGLPTASTASLDESASGAAQQCAALPAPRALLSVQFARVWSRGESPESGGTLRNAYDNRAD